MEFVHILPTSVFSALLILSLNVSATDVLKNQYIASNELFYIKYSMQCIFSLDKHWYKS